MRVGRNACQIVADNAQLSAQSPGGETCVSSLADTWVAAIAHRPCASRVAWVAAK